MTIDQSAATLDPQHRYKLLTSLIAPRPIALVSTVDAAGARNVSPFSFFMMGGGNPPSLCFSVLTDRRRGTKDTLANIQETGEFVVNVVTRSLAERVNQASGDYARAVDEFAMSGLTPEPSVAVRAPRVLESPAALECKLFQIVPHGSGPQAANYVIGEIVHMRVLGDALRDDGLFDSAGQQLVGRMGRDEWATVVPEGVFSLARPVIAL